MASDIVLQTTAQVVEEHAHGMPQLDFATFPNQWFWLIVTLGVLYFVLSKIALPRIASVLSMRQEAISRDIELAEELKQKAVEAQDAYNKALVNARAEAGRIVADAKAEIQKDLDIAFGRAEAEISAQTAESESRISEIREGALKSVEIVAKNTAREIVKALMPGLSDAKATDAAVRAKLKG